MRLTFRTLGFVLLGLAVATSGAYAERTSATPVTGETVTLFGAQYTVNGINTMTTTWLGAGGLENNCGLGLGWRQGASPAQDQLFLADECDGGGEDIAILTGVDPVTYAPTAAVTTSSYIVNAAAGGFDPSGIEWINDTDTGAGLDPNYRFPVGVTFQMMSLDADGIPYAGYTTPVDTVNAGDGYKGLAACKNAKDDTATRMYYGGVDVEGPNSHFAYLAFDLTTNQFVSAHSVHLDGIGTPDDGSQPDRAFRGLAFDGTYYYAMVKKPGAAESWLYRYSAFPDPPVGADQAHPETTPPGFRLDDPAGGVAWPSAANRPDRAGIACGRIVNGAPIFYVLCDTWLYTLVPQTADVDGYKVY